ncbi:HSP90 family protein [Weeksellaceae bacterium TAE3-ERU29]|nr:HSP90 family protein [Weeksellaceae bacterium TAE3-ERU29]
MNKENHPYKFQVNMKGMISLLSEHIYSSPDVFIRELLQNAIDAITVRRSIDPEFIPEIEITLQENTLKFKDNGIGLSPQDVHEFLSVIGQSSKSGELADKELIGKFGIGLLSCLVVSEDIRVESRSLIKDESVVWIGYSDGTYEVQIPEQPLEVGTQVILHAKKEHTSLFQKETLIEKIRYYGDALPFQIYFKDGDNKELIIDGKPIWLNPDASKEELLKLGKEVFKTKFLDVFPISSDTGEIQGVAYVIPRKVNTTVQPTHRIYVKRMFLTEQAGHLLPEWSSFVRCIINTNALQPTASRETLMNNTLLQSAKNDLKSCFKEYLKLLSVTKTDTLQRIIEVHHLHIKALASMDKEIMETFIPYLPFETNQGLMTLNDMRNIYSTLYYTPSLDDFRQIRRIAGSKNKLVINAAYSYEADLIEKLKQNSNDDIKQIYPEDLLGGFESEVEEDENIRRFIQLANQSLKNHFCEAKIKRFEPKDTPALYVANDKMISQKNIRQMSPKNNPFAKALGKTAPEEEKPILCFNYDNEIITHLLKINDPLLVEAFIMVFYVQALMLGGYSINQREMKTFNEALYQLMVLGMSDFLPKI